MTDEQTLRVENTKTSKPGFGPNCWIMASMELRKGLKISMSPRYSTSWSPLNAAKYGHILGENLFIDGSVKKHQAWVLEYAREPYSPKVNHLYLIDRPPYCLGTETVRFRL